MGRIIAPSGHAARTCLRRSPIEPPVTASDPGQGLHHGSVAGSREGRHEQPQRPDPVQIHAASRKDAAGQAANVAAAVRPRRRPPGPGGEVVFPRRDRARSSRRQRKMSATVRRARATSGDGDDCGKAHAASVMPRRRGRLESASLARLDTLAHAGGVGAGARSSPTSVWSGARTRSLERAGARGFDADGATLRGLLARGRRRPTGRGSGRR